MHTPTSPPDVFPDCVADLLPNSVADFFNDAVTGEQGHRLRLLTFSPTPDSVADLLPDSVADLFNAAVYDEYGCIHRLCLPTCRTNAGDGPQRFG